MSHTEVDIGCRLIVPADGIADVKLSLPQASRVAGLAGLKGKPPSAVERALRDFDPDFDALPPDQQRDAVSAFQKRLKGIDGDAVWLIPKPVQAKPSYTAHLKPFQSGHRPALLGFGLRDTYQNLFKVGYIGGDDPLVLHRPNEPLGDRRYAMLYATEGETGLAIGKAAFQGKRVAVEGESRPIRFGVTSTPIVWNGRPVPLCTRLGFQSDLRHEFHIEPSRWNAVHKPLQSLVMSAKDPAMAGAAVVGAARGLRAENGYYLSSVGVGRDGRLILISAHGSVDHLIRLQLKAGAERALMTEEGGSCGYALWECEKDFQAADQIKRDQAGEAVWEDGPRCFGMNTYWRPNALALCVIQLKQFLVEPPFWEDPSGGAASVAFD